jgi:hypothetical protein
VLDGRVGLDALDVIEEQRRAQRGGEGDADRRERDDRERDRPSA